MDEKAYLLGKQSVYLDLLSECVKYLAGDADLTLARQVRERMETIHVLRRVCGEFGDNEWPDEMYLPDIIEKHLEKWLHAR